MTETNALPVPQPRAVLARRGTLGVLTVLYPFFIVVLFADLSNALMKIFGLPSLLQGLILVIALLVWHSRRSLSLESAVGHPVTLLLAAYAVVVFTTTIWAPDVSAADARLSEAVKAVVICILVAAIGGEPARFRSALIAVTAAAAVLSAVSLLQITGVIPPSLGGYVELESGTIYGTHSAPRAAGPPVTDPNFYGRVLLLALPVALALAATAGTRRRRIACLAASALVTGAVLATYSRGAMLTLGVIGFLMLLLFPLRRTTRAWFIAAALVTALLVPDDLRQRLLSIEFILPSRTAGVERDSSVEKRRLLMGAAVEMFKDHPIIGVGAGHFGHHYPAYADRIGTAFTDYHDPGTREYPHGLYLELASETGLAGLATLGGALLAGVAAAFRSRRRLARSGWNEDALLAAALGIVVIAYLVASIFLHETHLRYIGLQLGLVAALHRISRDSGRSPEAAT